MRFLTIGRGAQTVGLSSSTVKNSTREVSKGERVPASRPLPPSCHPCSPPLAARSHTLPSLCSERPGFVFPRKASETRSWAKFYKFRPQDMLRQTWLFSLSTQHSLSLFFLSLPRNFNLFQGRGLPHGDVNSCHRTGNRVRFHPVLSSSRNGPWVRRGPCIVTDHGSAKNSPFRPDLLL